MQEFIEAPRQEFVDTARDLALSPPRQLSPLEIEELSWARANPAGQADSPSDDLLLLWNFDVADAQLKDAHLAALRKFVGLLVLAEGVSFTVTGHASPSGSHQENERLGAARAAAVARVLSELGRFRVTTETRGEQEPRDAGSTGLALARNRRVEIRRLGTPPRAGPETAPEFFIPGPPLDWRPIPTFLPSTAAAFESAVDWDLGTWVVGGGRFVVSGKIEGKIKVKFGAKGAALPATVQLKDGKLNGQIESVVRDGIKQKLTVDPTAATIKYGFQASDVPLKPEIGVQTKPQFVYVNFTFADFAIGTMVTSGTELTFEFTGKIKFDIGPGPALVAELARFAPVGQAAAASAAAVAAPAVVVGAIGVALTFQAATIHAVAWSKEEGIRRCQLIAARDALASRAALNVSGPGASRALEDRLSEWRRFVEVRVRQAASAGYNEADAGIKALSPEQLQQRVNQWKARYGQRPDGSEDLQFVNVRERMFLALGGYSAEGDAPELTDL